MGAPKTSPLQLLSIHYSSILYSLRNTRQKTKQLKAKFEGGVKRNPETVTLPTYATLDLNLTRALEYLEKAEYDLEDLRLDHSCEIRKLTKRKKGDPI